jgi:4-hydroxy-3-polyprenylbenzoate decarboxylase
MSESPRILLAMTGASGAAYGLRLLECLLQAGRDVYLTLTKPAQIVIGMETDLRLGGGPREIERSLRERFPGSAGQLTVLGQEQWTAPVASGSGAPEAMIVCPCTTGTLANLAAGLCTNLSERAADVVLKERRKLIIVLREMPLSRIHLENMLRLTEAGAIMMPANPGFYHDPRSVQDIVDFVVARILDQLEVPHELVPRWGSHDE